MANGCEWDSRKAESNWRKLGVRFDDAAAALEDEMALTIRDPAAEERRWITVARDPLGRVLVVIYAWRNERVRIISARRATASERRQYEEKR